MSIDEWNDALCRAAECGSDCLRDTWVMIPAEVRDELSTVMRECRIAAVSADIAVREGSANGRL